MGNYKYIKKRVQNSHISVIKKGLGYNTLHKVEKIINAFVNSKDLYSWFHSGYYDFTYTPESFLQKLCFVFQLDYSKLEDELYKQNIYYNEVQKVQKNYLFIDTNFKRTNEPIFALACLEHTRRVHLDVKDVVFKNLEQTLQIVAKQVQEHYEKTKGKLKLWGEIVHYVYHHEDKIFTFDLHGNIIQNQITTQNTPAILTLKGRVLC